MRGQSSRLEIGGVREFIRMSCPKYSRHLVSAIIPHGLARVAPEFEGGFGYSHSSEPVDGLTHSNVRVRRRPDKETLCA